ncbi:putative baseplate assembly protein [Myxococcus fulvus]|uniref:Baseplate assembly protein n=1 Tax=Myxococcus fulvus TaxID=33 RepID=A0A511T8D0_MYXFU|nr:putative baseplate assembly protein [Myxococcus fulvus]GEN10277.1 putative baseplate assembly protein [Myxococcus fulvus]SEU34759.1 putative baseplate assembly protein [Myxococcus fulvus]
MSTSIKDSGDCDACESQAATEAAPLYNRPGQPALAYRIGTHSRFFQRMLARLPREFLPDGEFAGTRPLAALSTRGTEDLSIAMLDAWATAADVLTFYQERIANEGFLRTATERRSVLELARQLGYELKPGVAASTYLVFTVETAPGAPSRVQVPVGVQVLSIPGQDARPQTFETTEALEARAEWNLLRVPRTQAQPLMRGEDTLYLRGLQPGIQPGDALLLVGEERESQPGSEQWDLRWVKTVKQVSNPKEPELNHTVVTWEPGLGSESPRMDPADHPRAFVLRLRGNLFGYNAPSFKAMPDEVKQRYNPDYRPGDARFTQWPQFENTTAVQGIVDLDREYPTLVHGSWVALWKSRYLELYRITDIQPWAREDFTMTAKVTRLTFDTNEHLSYFPLRSTVVLAQSEELPIGEMPRTDAVQGDSIELDRAVAGLEPKHVLLIEGRTLVDGQSGEWLRQVVALDRAEALPDGRTRLVLQEPLAAPLARDTVLIHGNVAPSTHGETVREVLGGGDGSRTHQRFVLRKPPLTYVAAPTDTGGESTLELRVNGVLWKEVPTLFGQDERAEVYMVRLQDDGAVVVTFGDGVSGARLPTGQENITAVYRSGIGPEGEVDSGQLALLKVRPLGIREVNNPLPATGAAAPESRDEARDNAPASVLTLRRVVSLQDYEDFASTFAGIGKAQAADLTNGERILVHVTVAAHNGEPVEPGTQLHESLEEALRAHHDPVRQFALSSYERIHFAVEARLRLDARYLPEDVLARAEAALREAFSFERRQFAQAVSGAEVIRVLQDVPGVVMVDLERLHPTTPFIPEQKLFSVIRARGARWERTLLRPAQLLLLDPSLQGERRGVTLVHDLEVSP